MKIWSRLCAGVALAWLAAVVASSACRRGPAVDVPPMLPEGGNFSLTDHNGRRFELSSLRGSAVVMFFGFTTCPDACPATLSKLSSVYRRLGAEAKRMKTLYVSIDPERDTPAVLKADLANFKLDALGLTGTKADIDKVAALYGGTYEIVPTPDSAARSTVSHTTTIYVLDTDGRLRLRFRSDASVDQIAQGVRSILAEPSDSGT